MKIGIYGGSFNPVHKGHIKIASYAIDKLELDKLYFVPAYKSPFKSKVKYAAAEDRVAMLEEVKPEKSEVHLFEINRKCISYTIDTVQFFKQKFPNDELFLIIGSDNVDKLNKWRSIDEISKLVKIVVFRRNNDFSKTNIKQYNCLLLDNSLFDFASSWFRKGFMDNTEPLTQKYIAKNFLYVPDIMLNMLDAKRHKHSVAVGQLAASIAKVVNYDAKRAWFAGSMHDITKSWPKQEHRDFLVRNHVDETNVRDFELHSLSGYYWLKNEYKLEDDEILNAVLRHTSLALELTLLDKILFVADKLAEGRKFEGIQKVRELVMNNFDEGFKATVKSYYDELLHERGVDAEQKQIFEKWIK